MSWDDSPLRLRRGRTTHLVSALCFLTLGAFALPLMRATVALAPPPPIPPGVTAPDPSPTPFDPDTGEEDSEEVNSEDESSPAPTDPMRARALPGKEMASLAVIE